MSNKPKINKYKSLRNAVTRLRDDLRDSDNGGSDFVLLYAYNGTGKTRLSMEFKDVGKRKKGIARDTLYFNAFTEDLFIWDNDLIGDSDRALMFNENSEFFKGLDNLALEVRIEKYLSRYTTFSFDINYQKWKITFKKEVANPKFRVGSDEPEKIVQDNIKISRGEENIFIWCFFLSICEVTLDGAETYNWVKFFYIDDPVSSLDDNNTIKVATDLAKLLRRAKGEDEKYTIKTVISSHHGLFFNIMCNELKKTKHKTYLLNKADNSYTLQATDDTPFYHHIATLSELNKAAETGDLFTYHFNALRTIFEKTSNFFGNGDISYCLDTEDEALHARALNIFSHRDAYSIWQPSPMLDDNKRLFETILKNYLERFEIELP
ncbi:AAA family ATPase [Pseudoalteromonas sp. NEC-BIFX-2020_002]|uniref:AAA family ATPase n=1 Tax=Pseudoalteromonas sp. NEC-BIFX-2020_002 TaxID=2732353 RepID=UPI0014777818|nr:AAA family ATPase [Pseudoalteromonas sp. NEC-BIFX-2020_002]NNG43531.1 AAA family ATPase [Pseudoalteromonas sp. NEC-BIFX-2020_002]